ncbi:MAG: ABC transporter permease [Chloroflexi bacterium]|nr:MAG: ABC transporter permease [Chloroflexota bacterium]
MTVRRPPELAGASAIWIREIRSRMRGKRAFVFLTFYLTVFAGLLWIGLRSATEAPLSALQAVSVGRDIYAAVVLIETLVVLILAPAYTAASISQEREKGTFDLLAVTPISSLAIVVGKLVSALLFLAVVVGASIPLASVAFLFGGVGLDDIVRSYIVIVAVGIGAGAVGVACSAVFRRSQPATVAAFIAVALIAGGSSVMWFSLEARVPEGNTLLYLDPFVGQADVLCLVMGNGCRATPAPRATDIPRPAPVGVANPDAAPPPSGPAPTEPGSVWPWTVLAWVVVAVVAMLVAADSVSPTRRFAWRPGRIALPRRPSASGE